MRLDQEHAHKVKSNVVTDADGNRIANFDIEFMLQAFSRINPWERGILTDALLRSAEAKRLTIEQRALLALFLPTCRTLDDQGGDDE